MTHTSPEPSDELKWASFILFLAAVYNVVWGAVAIAAPLQMLAFVGVTGDFRTEFWQCIGMFVALYGLGYWFASTDPIRYWPFVLVGLIGKVLGPVGAVLSVASGALPTTFIWVNVINDFVWWAPFAWILWTVHRSRERFAPYGGRDPEASLYHSVLGWQFNQLAPQVRQFHDSMAPVEVRGVFSSTRGDSRIGNWLTDRSGFPRSQESLDVSLIVDPTTHGENWRRIFAGTVVESWQYEAHGHLVERFGPLTMHLQPQVVAGVLEITDIRSTFLGMPLPPFLTPRVHARGVGKDEEIEVTVQVGSSPFGLLVEYHGHVAIAGGPQR